MLVSQPKYLKQLNLSVDKDASVVIVARIPLMYTRSHNKLNTADHSVPAKGGLVCEGAVTKATHVGFLSSVNTLVPLEGVELCELLVTVLTAVRTFT